MGVFGPLLNVKNLIASAPFTVEYLKPVVSSNTHLPGERVLNWSTATVAATTQGDLQPASTEALERVGRVGKVGVWEVYTTPAPGTPAQRVRIGTQQYEVLAAGVFPTHNELIVEEVTT